MTGNLLREKAAATVAAGEIKQRIRGSRAPRRTLVRTMIKAKVMSESTVIASILKNKHPELSKDGSVRTLFALRKTSIYRLSA